MLGKAPFNIPRQRYRMQSPVEPAPRPQSCGIVDESLRTGTSPSDRVDRLWITLSRYPQPVHTLVPLAHNPTGTATALADCYWSGIQAIAESLMYMVQGAGNNERQVQIEHRIHQSSYS